MTLQSPGYQISHACLQQLITCQQTENIL